MHVSARRVMLTLTAFVLALAGATSAAHAGAVFHVSFSGQVRSEPATGRLLVFLVRDGGRTRPGTQPLDGPSWTDPQPLFGIDVKDLQPGAVATVDDSATSFPEKPSVLPPGTYLAQARLDTSRTNSEWRRDAGNLFTRNVVTFTVENGKDTVVDLALDAATTPEPMPRVDGVEVFEMRSKLLSEFRGHDVMLRAGVRLPLDYDPAKSYAAVYEVPGYGGDHRGAFDEKRRVSATRPGTGAGDMARAAFWIVLDPESSNGHTLFANSANNGPCGDALVKELIPALEKKYRLNTAPEARLLRGHSSGGWSTLWLALKYPDTFGACWSSSPDPVDFRRMQRSDIYSGASMYTEPDPDSPGATRETPSFRVRADPKMTVRQENLMEEVVGPHNTSAQQWDSWLAVWGPKGADGHPAALYDPVTGAIDHAVAEKYRAYDIGELLRAGKGVLGPIFKQRIRLIVGDLDSFYLNESVALLKDDVDKLSFFRLPEGDHGYITVVPGADHGTVLRSPEGRAIEGEMLKHLRDWGAMPK